MICSMAYCEMEPYYTKSNVYFREHVGVQEMSYWQWMIQEYKCVLLNKDGSWSDVPERHWAFNSKKDRDWFILRWA